MNAHQAKVLGLCVSLLDDRAEGEDAAQETFVKAYRSLRSFRSDARLSTWLYRIASNHCKDVLRKRGREKAQSLEALVAAAKESGAPSPEPSEDPRARMAAADLAKALLGALTPDEREILTLREAQGLSYGEIAEALGCSLDAVKARLRRARLALDEKSRHFFGPADV